MSKSFLEILGIIIFITGLYFVHISLALVVAGVVLFLAAHQPDKTYKK